MMPNANEKVMMLEEAIRRFVKDGCHLSIGGFTINRNPMAAVYEIIRHKIRHLHVYAHSNGQGVDELIGGGCVDRLEIAYCGSGIFAPTCVRFSRAVTEGNILVEDYSNYQMTLRFAAGAMGVPFLPTRSSLATDIIAKWGFSEEQRKEDDRLPNKKMCVVKNPFDRWADCDRVVLVPAINPDVTIIHVQTADVLGTSRISGLTFADVEQAKSAKYLIITCERLVAADALKDNPDHNHIPFFNVDAVVHVPYGAYPTACYKHYDYDPVYLKNYKNVSKDDELYREYLEEYVYGVKDQAAFLSKIGADRLERIKADPVTGYARNLERI
ncbi:MAG: CoA-transferase [Deltaproteobacteria bacterium]